MSRSEATEEKRGILYPDESYKIIGVALRVWKHFGYGLREFIYENSMIVGLKKQGFQLEQQKIFRVYYEDEFVGEQKVDLLVNNIILLEFKAVERICDEHIAQVLNYLKITEMRLGLLINFGPTGMEYRRVAH